MKKTTLVFGGSVKQDRYANKAIKMLTSKNVETKAFAIREGEVNDVVFDTELLPYKDIDTVTLYINPKRQKAYYDYIVKLKPRRVIFNPGTENIEFIELLQNNGIEAEVACTLVLLSTNQY